MKMEKVNSNSRLGLSKETKRAFVLISARQVTYEDRCLFMRGHIPRVIVVIKKQIIQARLGLIAFPGTNSMPVLCNSYNAWNRSCNAASALDLQLEKDSLLCPSRIVV